MVGTAPSVLFVSSASVKIPPMDVDIVDACMLILLEYNCKKNMSNPTLLKQVKYNSEKIQALFLFLGEIKFHY